MARSRTPPRGRQLTERQPPRLKQWVLVRTRCDHRWRWANATPALVSGLSLGEDGQTRVDVVVPNLLALRHGFGGRGFHELSNLPLSWVRPHVSGNLPQLKQQLLEAVRQVVRAEQPSAEAEAS